MRKKERRKSNATNCFLHHYQVLREVGNHGLSYALDNQTLINHWVPNLAFSKGVGNHDLRNKLIINHLKTTTCQTYCIVLKIDPAGGMDWQAKRLEGKIFSVRYIDSAGQIHLKETGIALIPGVDEYKIVK